MKKCPFCAEDIQDAAIICKHCGADLVAGVPRGTVTVVQQAVTAAPSRGVAIVLSLFIPGAGQMYSGRVLAGFVWLIAVVIGYAMLIVPGLILHVLCIVSAGSGDVFAPSAPPTPTPPPPTQKSQNPQPATRPAPRTSTTAEKGLGRGLAFVLHPAAAWRSSDGVTRLLLLTVYIMVAVVAGRFVLNLQVSPARPPAASVAPSAQPIAQAVATSILPASFAMYRLMITGTGETCDRVVRSFVAGKDKRTGNTFVSVACADGHSYQVSGTTTPDSIRVLSCPLLYAVTKLKCFESLQ